MRQVQQRVHVTSDPLGTPLILVWRKREFRVRRSLDDWSYAGRWWLSEPERFYYLIELGNGWVAEVYREEERWVLAALHD